MLYLALGHVSGAVKVLVCFVDDVKNLQYIAAILQFLLVLELVHLEAISLLYQFGHTVELLLVGRMLAIHSGDVYSPVHPHGILFKAQCLEVVVVVGIVIHRIHRPHLVITLEKHTLLVQVGETQRTNDGVHATLLAPLLHGADESLAHLQVVNEVYPSESHIPGSPFLVCPVVYNGRHTSHNLAVSIGEEPIGVAKLEGCVIVLVESVQGVLKKIGHSIGAILVHFIVETNKILQFSLGGDAFDLKFRHSFLMGLMCI